MIDDKKYLLKRLAETHEAIKAIIAGIDLNLRVYNDTDWMIRDIIGHIATWDREMINTLQAFLKETEYFIPDLDEDESDYNAQAVLDQRKYSEDQILAEWNKARAGFISVIRDIPDDRFPGDFVYPWGDERGSIRQLVDYFVEHDEEHRDEILNALKSNK